MPFKNPAEKSYIKANTNWNEVAGVYGIFDTQGQCIYVGKTDNLKRRMAEHMETAPRQYAQLPDLVSVVGRLR